MKINSDQEKQMDFIPHFIQIKKVLAILLLSGLSTLAYAQHTPMKSQYFQNPYLGNPAMAGYAGRPVVFGNYANQWNLLDGAPVMLSFSGSSPITSKASVGLNVIADKAGLLQRSQAMGTYAYKVELSEEQSMRFGVSLSWSQDRLDISLASGDSNSDPGLVSYNSERENYLDGNFGMAYIAKRFEAQFSILNLNQKRQHQFSTVDYATFYSALSYLIPLDEGGAFSVKPLIAYRGIKGYDNQFDVAAAWGYETLNFYTMYHSNKSFSGGMGFQYQQHLLISAMYNSEPKALRGLSGGIFDVVLGYEF